MEPVIEVALIDNDRMLLGSTTDEWLSQCGVPIKVGARAATVAELLAQPEPRPAIALLDIMLRDGTHVADNVAALLTSGHVVIAMSSDNHDGLICRAIEAGAHSYVHKHPDPAELVEAVRAAAQGEQHTSREEAAALAASPSLVELSPRQRQVVELFVSGMEQDEIAEELYITLNTVKEHINRIKEKFAAKGRPVHNLTQLRTELLRAGILQTAD